MVTPMLIIIAAGVYSVALLYLGFKLGEKNGQMQYFSVSPADLAAMRAGRMHWEGKRLRESASPQPRERSDHELTHMTRVEKITDTGAHQKSEFRCPTIGGA